MLYEVLKAVAIEGFPNAEPGMKLDLDPTLAEPMVADGTLKVADPGTEVPGVAAPEQPKLTPEEIVAKRRTAYLADMIVGFKQEIEMLDMNLERSMIYVQFWTRMAGSATTSKETKLAQKRLMDLAAQRAGLAADKENSEAMLAFLDEAMSGKVEINYNDYNVVKQQPDGPGSEQVEEKTEEKG